jgi:hypothetical protein
LTKLTCDDKTTTNDDDIIVNNGEIIIRNDDETITINETKVNDKTLASENISK